MSLLPRIRLLLARRPWIYWTFVALIAATGAAVVGGAVRGVNAQRGEWGTARTVWVASGDVAAGDVIDAESRSYPLAMVPHSAIDQLPAASVARHRLGDGEIIVSSDITVDGPVALIPEGWLAVPVANAPPGYRPGDEVSLLADGVAVTDGVVVSADEAAIMVAVPAADAAAVGAAALSGSLIIALAP